MVEHALTFEQGPIRPPSEAASLLIRLTRNCPWNRCLFCPVYKAEKFSRRSLAEIKNDIENIALVVQKIGELSLEAGSAGEITREIVLRVREALPGFLPAAVWLYHGTGTVFLQDADSLQLPTDQLAEILSLVRQKIPAVKRITTYARSRSLLRKTAADLARLKDCGLDRIHVGMESGCDPVLEYMQKGITGEEQVEAGLRVKQAGISLSEYVILGLGGARLSREHAETTAAALNEINPDYIRMRTLAVHPASPLWQRLEQGEFTPLDDEGILIEEKCLLKRLGEIGSIVQSDHILNLLEEVAGRMPGDRVRMIGVIESYFALPGPQRERFRLGRRAGIYRLLGDRESPALADRVEQLYQSLAKDDLAVDQYIRKAVLGYF